jgi:hypothetical protein
VSPQKHTTEPIIKTVAETEEGVDLSAEADSLAFEDIDRNPIESDAWLAFRSAG